jgi:hypothetical protein
VGHINTWGIILLSGSLRATEQRSSHGHDVNDIYRFHLAVFFETHTSPVLSIHGSRMGRAVELSASGPSYYPYIVYIMASLLSSIAYLEERERVFFGRRCRVCQEVTTRFAHTIMGALRRENSVTPETGALFSFKSLVGLWRALL